VGARQRTTTTRKSQIRKIDSATGKRGGLLSISNGSGAPKFQIQLYIHHSKADGGDNTFYNEK
jgi:hypothetical protein